MKWMNSGRSRIQCPICKKIISRHTIITIYQEWPAPGSSESTGTSRRANRNSDELANDNQFIRLLESQKASLIDDCKEFVAQNQFLTVKNNELIVQVEKLSAVQKQNVELLNVSRSEKQQQSHKLIVAEQELARCKRELAKLKVKANYLEGLDTLNRLEDFSNEQQAVLFKNYMALDPDGKMSLFYSLEHKCKEIISQRKMYFKFFQEEKKKTKLLQERLDEALVANLMLEKDVDGNPHQTKAKARPCPSSTPEPKVSRIENSNPFLRRVDTSSSSQASFDSLPALQKTPKRARSFSSETRDALGDGLQALSIDPEIIVIDDDNVPPSAPRQTHGQPKAPKRDIHSFFT